MSVAHRRLAALSHLGIPIYSLFLPLLLWGISAQRPFVRLHARQAFSFQCIVFVVHLALISRVIYEATTNAGVQNSTLVVDTAWLGLAFVLQLPQIVLALMGRNPLRLIPFEPLPR